MMIHLFIWVLEFLHPTFNQLRFHHFFFPLLWQPCFFILHHCFHLHPSLGHSSLATEFVSQLFRIIFGKIFIEVIHSIKGYQPHTILKILNLISFYQYFINDFPDNILSRLLNSCKTSWPSFLMILPCGSHFHSLIMLSNSLMKHTFDTIFSKSFLSLFRSFSISLYFLIILHWSKAKIFHSLKLLPAIFTYFHLMNVFIYDMLFIRNIMKSRTCKFEVAKIITKLTLLYFKLIRNISAFVS